MKSVIKLMLLLFVITSCETESQIEDVIVAESVEEAIDEIIQTVTTKVEVYSIVKDEVKVEMLKINNTYTITYWQNDVTDSLTFSTTGVVNVDRCKADSFCFSLEQRDMGSGNRFNIVLRTHTGRQIVADLKFDKIRYIEKEN